MRTVKTTSRPRNALLENKEEQLNQLKETLEAERERNPSLRAQVEKDEDGIVFDRGRKN